MIPFLCHRHTHWYVAPRFFVDWNNERIDIQLHDFLCSVETLPLQIQEQTFIASLQNFVAQMFSSGDSANFAAKFHQRVAIVSITIDNSHRRIHASKDCSKEERKCHNPAKTNTITLRRCLKLCCQQQAKRWNGWENPVHSLRWNKRHHQDPAECPGDQPKHFGRNFLKPFS